MKKNIHSPYYVVKIACACGAVFETRSTKKEGYAVEICSNCHPFYKGTEEEKLVDRYGRIEKFKKKYGYK